MLDKIMMSTPPGAAGCRGLPPRRSTAWTMGCHPIRQPSTTDHLEIVPIPNRHLWASSHGGPPSWPGIDRGETSTLDFPYGGCALPMERFGAPYAHPTMVNYGNHNGGSHGHRPYYSPTDFKDFYEARRNNITPLYIVQSPITRIDFLSYNGSSDPTKWVHYVEYFFHSQKTRKNEKVELTSFHLKQEALQFF